MSGSTGSLSQDGTKPSRMLIGGQLWPAMVGDVFVVGGLADWMVPSAPASTSALVSGGIASASRYSGLPSASFVPLRPSRAKPLLAPGMSTHLPLNAALLALISAMAACTAARFRSTFSLGTGWPPVARPWIEKGSAFRMTTPPFCTPLVPAVNDGVPKRNSFAAGFSIRPNQGPRLNPTGTSPASSSSASMPHCLNCHTAHAVASLYAFVPVSRPPKRLLA